MEAASSLQPAVKRLMMLAPPVPGARSNGITISSPFIAIATTTMGHHGCHDHHVVVALKLE